MNASGPCQRPVPHGRPWAGSQGRRAGAAGHAGAGQGSTAAHVNSGLRCLVSPSVRSLGGCTPAAFICAMRSCTNRLKTAGEAGGGQAAGGCGWGPAPGRASWQAGAAGGTESARSATRCGHAGMRAGQGGSLAGDRAWPGDGPQALRKRNEYSGGRRQRRRAGSHWERGRGAAAAAPEAPTPPEGLRLRFSPPSCLRRPRAPALATALSAFLLHRRGRDRTAQAASDGAAGRLHQFLCLLIRPTGHEAEA